MSATDELRRLLDERGIEYRAYDEPDESIICTQWEACGFLWDADDREERIYLSADRLITPEQVIAATLGPRSDSCNCTNGERTNLAVTLGDADATQARRDVAADVDEIIEHVINANMLSMPYYVYSELFDAVDGLGVEIENLQQRITTQKQTIQAYRDESREWREVAEHAQAENTKLRELCADMWRDGMCECDERGTCATCEYGYLDRMRELRIEVDG